MSLPSSYHWLPNRGLASAIARKQLQLVHYENTYDYSICVDDKLGLPLFFGTRVPPPVRELGHRIQFGIPAWPLREHQHAPVDAMGAGYRGLVRMDPGRGKTYTSLVAAWTLGSATLVVVHSQLLFDQWLDAICTNFGIGAASVGVVRGPRSKWTWEGCGVTVAMLQTLATHYRNLPPGFLDYFGTAIFDEVHHMQGEWFSKGVFCSPRRRWGLSATPFGGTVLDTGIRWNFGGELYADPADTPYDVPPTIEFHWMEPNSWWDDSLPYDVDNRQTLLLSGRKLRLALDITREAAASGSVVLTQHPHKSKLNKMFKMFCEETGLDSEVGYLHGDVPRKKRAGMAARPILFGLQHNQVTIEGFDRPETDVVVVTGPCTGVKPFHQTIGRAGRIHPGKGSSRVVFICDDIPRARELLRERAAEAAKKGATIVWEASRTPRDR